jgi:putative FmdB family regulatory protein
VPIYEYTCKACDARFEKLVHSVAARDDIPCPSCGSRKTNRALSVFAVSAEGAKKSEPTPPGTCGRCGGPGPCAFG